MNRESPTIVFDRMSYMGSPSIWFMYRCRLVNPALRTSSTVYQYRRIMCIPVTKIWHSKSG